MSNRTKKKKSQNHCGFRTFLELLARFELATSSLPIPTVRFQRVYAWYKAIQSGMPKPIENPELFGQASTNWSKPDKGGISPQMAALYAECTQLSLMSLFLAMLFSFSHSPTPPDVGACCVYG